MKLWAAREHALQNIGHGWDDSFHLLYSYKAEVEKASQGSVVEIDHLTVQYKEKEIQNERNCFRRAFVSFKA